MSARTGDKSAREVRIELIQHLTDRGYTIERIAPLVGMEIEKCASLADRVGLLVKHEKASP